MTSLSRSLQVCIRKPAKLLWFVLIGKRGVTVEMNLLHGHTENFVGTRHCWKTWGSAKIKVIAPYSLGAYRLPRAPVKSWQNPGCVLSVVDGAVGRRFTGAPRRCAPYAK